jgi:hypothetical protein
VKLNARKALVVAGLAALSVSDATVPSARARPFVRVPPAASTIRRGPVAVLPVTGRDSEYPVLAMNQSGRYVLSYPQNDPFGPLGVLVGSTSSRTMPAAQVSHLGVGSDVSPLEPAVAPDGRVALGWSVRRQLHPANREAFGGELAELAPGHAAQWRARRVLKPTVGYDPTDEATVPTVVFGAEDRIVEDWVIETRAGSRLVLGRQIAVGGPLQTRAVLRTRGATSIQPAGLAVDSAGNPVIAATVTPPGHGVAALTPTVAEQKDSAVAVTTGAHGVVESAELLRRGCSAEDLATRLSGQAAIAMLCNVTARRSQVWVSERSPHTRFQPAVRVSARSIDAAFPTVSITAAGHVCVVWDRIVGSAKHYDADVVRTEIGCAAPGRRFAKPTWQTSAYPTQLNAPQLLEGPSGPAVLRGESDERVVLQRLLPHGRLGSVVAVSGPNASNQEVAVDAQGRGVATWDASVDGKNRPEARTFALP